jgi:hypothetical protein
VSLTPFLRLVGKAPVSVRASYHVFPGASDTLQALWVGWADEGVSVKCSADGWGLAVSTGGLEPVDMGEAGTIEVREIDPASLFGGGAIVTVTALAPDDGPPIGVMLRTEDGQAMYLLNDGDQLVATRRPGAAIADIVEAPLDRDPG